MLVERFNQPNKNLDVDVYYCGYEDCCDNFKVGPTYRSEYLIHFVIKGNGFLKKNGKVFTVKEGDCFAILPGEAAYYWCDEIPAWSFCWFAFNGKQAEKYLVSMGFAPNAPVRFIGRNTTENIKIKITSMSYLLKNSSENKIALLSCLYGVFSIFESIGKQNIEHRKTKPYEYVEKALLFIEYNYDKKISVKEIANFLKLDRSYFGKIFKKQIDISPQEYILQYRVKKAAELLRTTNLKISEIAKCVGIEEEYYFWRIFKKYVGVPPGTYRREI